MKNKILATLVAFGLVGSVSAIEINDNLSVNGFVDGSYNKSKDRTTTPTGQSEKIGIDEVELNFLLNVSNVSGELHLDSSPSTNNDIGIEQAHFTYSLDNGLSFTFGKYGSKLGFEREDPAGMYTSSRNYDSATNFGDVDNLARTGLAANYSTDAFSLGLSLDQGQNDDLKTDGEGLNVELSLSYTGIENLTLNVGYREENAPTVGSVNFDTDHLNINASYQVGKALLAAEWQTESSKVANTTDLDAIMLLVDYDVSDKLGVAVRYTEEDQDMIAATSLENSKWTIAPNYSITDSLGAILEYSVQDVDQATGSRKVDTYGVELTYTF
jgi:hypothetical protein